MVFVVSSACERLGNFMIRVMRNIYGVCECSWMYKFVSIAKFWETMQNGVCTPQYINNAYIILNLKNITYLISNFKKYLCLDNDQYFMFLPKNYYYDADDVLDRLYGLVELRTRVTNKCFIFH